MFVYIYIYIYLLIGIILSISLSLSLYIYIPYIYTQFQQILENRDAVRAIRDLGVDVRVGRQSVG